MNANWIANTALLAAINFAVAADSTLPATNAGATDERWLPVQSESSEYKDAAGQEMVLIGRIGAGGAYPVGEPEKMQWSYTVQVDRPWMAIADLREYQKPFGDLRGDKSPGEFNQTKILMKSKIVPNRFAYGRPMLMVGWIRLLRPEDHDWQSPWPMNLALLPDAREAPIGCIVACQAVGSADTQLGFSGVYHGRQKVKVLEVFYGDAQPGQELNLGYSYVKGVGGDIPEGQKVIWVIVTRDDRGKFGCGALPDTPNNRIAAQELAKRLNKQAVQPRSNQSPDKPELPSRK